VRNCIPRWTCLVVKPAARLQKNLSKDQTYQTDKQSEISVWNFNEKTRKNGSSSWDSLFTEINYFLRYVYFGTTMHNCAPKLLQLLATNFSASLPITSVTNLEPMSSSLWNKDWTEAANLVTRGQRAMGWGGFQDSGRKRSFSYSLERMEDSLSTIDNLYGKHC
jgi:hypothetical protein